MTTSGHVCVSIRGVVSFCRMKRQYGSFASVLYFISQHYEYISNNLENEGDVVGNHYIIELTSLLLTIATFSFNEHEEEFKFYHDELEVELNKQFYKDGTNFEGSTHYSAFVTEAMILCKLAIEEIDKDSILLPRIEEIIKSNRLILSVLMNLSLIHI